MAGNKLKRSSNASTANGGSSKKKFKPAPPAESESDDNQFSLDGEEDEDDSEPNEFEMSDEDDLIGDDAEDLMAGLDDAGSEEEDEEEEDLEEGGEGSAEEEDADDFAAMEDAPTTIQPLKKANVRKSKAAKPLTPAELRALAFAELTASPLSSLLSTSTSALLSPLTPPAPSTSPLQPLLKELHSHITNFPSQKPSSLAKLKKKGKAVVPDVEGLDGKWGEMEFAWEKPKAEDVRIVGKWAWGGGIKVKGEYIVEMAVGMPESSLQPKDFMSPRFLIKSTHYLVTLSNLLPKDLLGPHSLSYSRLPGSQGWALDIRSSPPTNSNEKTGLSKIKGAVLRLRIVWPSSAFSHSKLSPLNNLARPALSSDSDTSTTSFPPTPLRSTSLHFSSLTLSTTHLKFHHSLSSSHPSYAPATRLLQTWATKRSYISTMGFSAEWWAWCVARTLTWGMGSGSGGGGDGDAPGGAAWATWRKAVEWLAGVNWTDGVWFRVEGDIAYPKDDLKNAFKGKPLFVDPTGTVNLAAGIALADLEMLKQDAKTTISLLLSNISDEIKFEAAFLKEIRASERFDTFARITVPSSVISSSPTDLDYSSSLEAYSSSLSSTISRALGTRARCFQLIAPPSPSILIPSSPTTSSSPFIFHLGILLDPAHSNRIVDQGPSAEDEAACEDFRTFWGSKSELRRFKDGSILESVVWDDEVVDPATAAAALGPQRNKFVGKILKHIISSRHGVPQENIDVSAGIVDHLIVEPATVRKAIFLEDAVATGKGFGMLTAAFDELVKELKGLDDLPLTVQAVQPCSPGLRYSTIFTPSSRRLKQFDRQPSSTKFTEVHEIIITLEGSGRWPDDLEGVQKIKAAFLARIAEGLKKLHTVVDAQLRFDLEARPVDDNVALDILTSTGFAFRARIFYERSLILLRERKAQIGGSAIPSLDAYKERFVHSPKHHAAIATLQHHFTSYSPTVRLVKRWFSSHMLLSHFPSELIELLVSNIFITPSTPYEPPQSSLAGFARTMELLSTWKWRDQPLFVPLYTFSTATTSGRRAAIPQDENGKLVKAFEEVRRKDPNVEEFAWVVGTEEDPKGEVWGKLTEKVAAGRVRGLANATLKALEEGLTNGNLVVEQLFAPPLSDYSFLLHIDSSINPRHFQALSPNPKALSTKPSSSIVAGTSAGALVGIEEEDRVRFAWDPVAEFVKAVEKLFPSVLLLFHEEGGSVIGGIWNPSAEGLKPWKIGHGFLVEPVKGAGEEGASKTKVQLNKRAVLGEIARLGKGLVVKVEVL